MTKLSTFISITFCLAFDFNYAQVNYDESKVPSYELADPLVTKSGMRIISRAEWKVQRQELLSLFENEVYGKIPGKLEFDSYELIESSDAALGGLAIRKQVKLEFNQKGKSLPVYVLMYLPKSKQDPPLFLGLNFYGNQTITSDPNVHLTDSWIRNNEEMGIANNKATEISRGKRQSRWPVRKIIEAGFGIVTAYYGDIDPDNNNWSDGIHPFFYEKKQMRPKPDEWGSIAAWAWGLSRIMDYIILDNDIKNSKVAVIGHSRLGKTALWAGANDLRFSLVISNNSGAGGAALFRRKYGETAAILNKNFPHWFCDNFNVYSDNEEQLPVDQHMLMALIAPRPVYVASAEEDRWADPKGEFLSLRHASSVFSLYGKDGFENLEYPDVNQPIHRDIAYHVRTGNHNVTDYDWEQYLKFARKHLEK